MTDRKKAKMQAMQTPPVPLYSTFPTAVDAASAQGIVAPDTESVEAVKDWGQESKL